MFDWNDSFSVGIDMIDEQHKKLFEIGESLHVLLSTDNTYDIYDEIIDILNELTEYTKYHFKTEEDLLIKYLYSDLTNHIKEHNKFVQYLTSIELDELDEDQKSHLIDLTEFVAKWIFKHISNTDFKYSDFLKGKMN